MLWRMIIDSLMVKNVWDHIKEKGKENTSLLAHDKMPAHTSHRISKNIERNYSPILV